KRGTCHWPSPHATGGIRAAGDLKAGNDTVTSAGKKITANALAALKKAGVPSVAVADAELERAFAATDGVVPPTGEVILEANEPLEPRVISMAQEKNVEKIEIFF